MRIYMYHIKHRMTKPIKISFQYEIYNSYTQRHKRTWVFCRWSKFKTNFGDMTKCPVKEGRCSWESREIWDRIRSSRQLEHENRWVSWSKHPGVHQRETGATRWTGKNCWKFPGLQPADQEDECRLATGKQPKLQKKTTTKKRKTNKQKNPTWPSLNAIQQKFHFKTPYVLYPVIPLLVIYSTEIPLPPYYSFFYVEKLQHGLEWKIWSQVKRKMNW